MVSNYEEKVKKLDQEIDKLFPTEWSHTYVEKKENLDPKELKRGLGSMKTNNLRHFKNDDKDSGMNKSRSAIELFNSWAELGRDVIMT